jgi:predicted dehydrogenase
MKIGIVGFGFMGGVHLAAIDRIEGVTASAVASRTRPVPGAPPRGNLAHVKSSSFRADMQWHSDWQELLDSDIDAVDICLPTYLHKPVILGALERGKHVLCEKPMALTWRDCEEILDAANRSGRVFMVAHVLRFLYPYRYAGNFLRSTCHGSVKTCTMQRRAGFPQWSDWLSKKEQSGGAILDLLIHDIDQALEWLGQPTAVRAVSDGDIDTMRGTLHYPGGLKVLIQGGWYAPELPFSASFQMEGDDAVLHFEEGKLRVSLSGEEQTVVLPEQEEYLEQMRYFVECCRDNTAPDRCLPADSAQAVRVANLLKASRDQDGKELSRNAEN